VKQRAAIALAALLLASCERRPEAPRVSAETAEAVFVWPGVHPAPTIKARTVYLLDGEVRRDGAARLHRLRMGPPRLPGRSLWLVVRSERLDWTGATRAAILADIAKWRAAGNAVEGLQVDFDASTRGLANYAAFLKDLRARLPGNVRLSITGLLDWSANGDPEGLAQLAGIVDEVVIQTYQARSTIPGYEAYFARLGNFPIPFRVALVEGGTWRAPPGLETHPRFLGYAVFLLAPPKS
jgi:hypothetical protein